SVFYQPVFRTSDGEITGFEAFLRVKMPDGSLENPSLVPLDQLDFSLGWEVTQRFHDRIRADLIAWEAVGLRPISLAINVTARELTNASTMDVIRSRIASSVLSARDLRFQVHGIYLEHPFAGALTESIHELRRAGCQIVLDNFGL